MLAVSAQINLSRPVIVMCKVHRFVYSWTCWALSWCKKLWKKGWLSSRQWCTTSCPTSEKSRRWMQFFLDVTTRKNKVRARPSASINTWSCGGLCNLHRLTMKQQGMTARCCWQNNRTRLRWLLNILSCFVPMGRCTCQATWRWQFHHFPLNLLCLNHFGSAFQLVLPLSSSYNPRIQTARAHRTVSTQTPFSWNKEQIDKLTAPQEQSCWHVPNLDIMQDPI